MKPLEPNKHSIGDAAHALAKAGLSAIPIVGGPAVELCVFHGIVNSISPKRDRGFTKA